MDQDYDFDDEDYGNDDKEMHQYRLDLIHFEQTTMDAYNDEPIKIRIDLQWKINHLTLPNRNEILSKM